MSASAFRQHGVVEPLLPSPFGILVHPDLYTCGSKDQMSFNHDRVCCIACISPAPKRHCMVAGHLLHSRRSLGKIDSQVPFAEKSVSLHLLRIAREATLKL